MRVPIIVRNCHTQHRTVLIIFPLTSRLIVQELNNFISPASYNIMNSPQKPI